MSSKLFIIILIGACGILIFVGGVYFIYHKLKARTEITVAENFIITDKWKEIDVKDQIPRLFKDSNDLYIAAPPTHKAFNVGRGRGIVAPDGTITKPEIEVIDSNGVVYSLKQTGAIRRSSYDMVTYSTSPEIPKGTQVTRIRVRANRSIQVPAIIWSYYDIKDLK